MSMEIAQRNTEAEFIADGQDWSFTLTYTQVEPNGVKQS